MKLEDLAKKINVDIKASLARFSGMESLYIKFLKKFKDEKSYKELEEGVKKGDLNAIKTSAHTLKGVAGNLGLTGVYEKVVKILEAHTGEDMDTIKERFKELKFEIELIIIALDELD